MQASGLEGPLPSSLSALNNMKDLWVLASKRSAILINIISLMCFSNLIKKKIMKTLVFLCIIMT